MIIHTMEKITSALEALPHVCNRVCLMWGTREFDAYIDSLVMDSRDGARKGLPLAVGAELLWLQNVNKLRRALDIQEKLGISLRDAYRKIQLEEEAAKGRDPWNAAGSGGGGSSAAARRPARTAQPPRRDQGDTLFAKVWKLATSRYTILLIVAILTFKAFWPNVRAFFE